jgi:hypothetical protein
MEKDRTLSREPEFKERLKAIQRKSMASKTDSKVKSSRPLMIKIKGLQTQTPRKTKNKIGYLQGK